MNRVVCSSVLIALCSSINKPMTLQFEVYDLMSQQLLVWLANLSSKIEVAVVESVAACFADRELLKAHPMFDLIDQSAILFFYRLNSKELCISQQSYPKMT